MKTTTFVVAFDVDRGSDYGIFRAFSEAIRNMLQLVKYPHVISASFKGLDEVKAFIQEK